MPPKVNLTKTLSRWGRGGGSQGKGSVVAFVVIFLTWRSEISPRVKVLWGRVYGVSSLSEKTRKSNYLHMSEQRQHVLPSYFYTLGADLRYTAPNGNTHTVIHCKLHFKLSQWKPQLRDNQIIIYEAWARQLKHCNCI